MIQEMTVSPISSSVVLKSFTDTSFKTMRLSVNMLTPLSQKTAAANAILPSLISRASRQYPDYTALNRRLSELYGASLSSCVRKFGGYQALSLSVDGIASRYAFGGEDMFAELSQLLFSVLLDPLLDGEGLFPEAGFRQEKRQLLEMKDAEYNDKMTFAHQRCEEVLFQGEEAGVNRCGSREDVEALRREDMTAAWQALLSNSRFEIFTLGDCRPDPAGIAARFEKAGMPHAPGPWAYREPQQARRVTERQPLSQSKLSMGFRTDAAPGERMLFQLMSAVLGGTPSSKLFQNVREKMGLCYYCSSSVSSASRAMFIESGVETANLDKAEAAVLDQLGAVQRGEVSEDELRFAKLALCNALHSVGDSLHAVDNWYLSRVFDMDGQTPEQAARDLESYTAADVAAAAQRLRLGAVYRLKGGEPG